MLRWLLVVGQLCCCVVFVYGDVCKRPIVSSAENLVHDWSFSATTYRENNPPNHARLNSVGAWCLPEVIHMQFPHYLEVELPRLYLVSAVTTLGGVTNAEYVTSYRIVHSVDGGEWRNVSVDGSQEIKSNTAAGDKDLQTRIVDKAVRARYIRFIPLDWGSVACMRVEICGHQLPHYPTVIVKELISSAILSWSTPDAGDEAIKKYYVRYWETQKGRSSSEMFESVASMAVVVPNLKPYTKYQLEVSGVSELGEGLARVSQFKTLETVPSGSPKRISFQFLGDTAVNISWAPPDEGKRNGDIIAYVICFPPSDGKCEDLISVPGSQTWFVLRGKDFNTQHEVEIRAETSKGVGPVGQATTGVLEYTAPEGVALSLIIATSCGVLLLALIVVVILAAKGVILKNFVRALRKLTSSQITISIKSDVYNKKRKAPYELPEETHEQTAENLYNTSNKNDAENIYDNLENVRKQTLNLAEEQIYSENAEQAVYGDVGDLLYPTQDQVVYDTRDQITRDQIVYETRDQVVSDTRDHVATPDQVVYPTREQITRDQIVYDTLDKVMYPTRNQVVYDTRVQHARASFNHGHEISAIMSNTCNMNIPDPLYQPNITHNQNGEDPYSLYPPRDVRHSQDVGNTHTIYTAREQVMGDPQDYNRCTTMQCRSGINVAFNGQHNGHDHIYNPHDQHMTSHMTSHMTDPVNSDNIYIYNHLAT